MSKWEVVVPFMAVLTVCFACKHEPFACDTPKEVSFQQDIIPLLNKHCSITDCHVGAAPTGNLNLEAAAAYAQLTQAGKGYVDTLEPKFSVLYASLISSTDPMPPTGKLDPCSIDLVFRWIEQKAKNN